MFRKRAEGGFFLIFKVKLTQASTCAGPREFAVTSRETGDVTCTSYSRVLQDAVNNSGRGHTQLNPPQSVPGLGLACALEGDKF